MTGPIRVVLAGASGRTGREVGKAILESPDMELVGAIGHRQAGKSVDAIWPGVKSEIIITRELPLCDYPAILVDFTEPGSAFQRVLEAAAQGWHVVIGTTGFTADQIDMMARQVADHGVGGALIANFSLGAWLLERLVKEAAQYFTDAELVEAHHPHKRDRPSGTAKRIASTLASSWGKPDDEIPVHAMRLPGMVAHQAVIFGAPGQILTVRHDVHDRSAYTTGALQAIRHIDRFPGRLIQDLGELVEH
ncbi:MAG: 4-hydroxy-tetrahydrodipicolinate reductase [Sulfobacillus benefaciens]|uniref:4-hydroxy-tetrahydrodipicolinate reductase n=1 Tax=Sulfobacillus benefaciens TaxID=453960 RepID=A0A2T2XHQ1_9FIRM|nr:MAG: 4-hydroxy-tetrahydrodipicolinate reductase [Sulfobacillus benefaciens]